MIRSYSKGPAPNVRQRILAAAAEIFGSKGYAATSVGEIATNAGITKPSLYYHFGSKEGLYRAVLDTCAAQADRLLDQVDQAGGTPWTKIEHLCHGLALLLKRDVVARRMMEADYLNPSQGFSLCVGTRLGAKIETSLWRYLIEGRQVGQFRYDHAEDALGLLMGSVLVSGASGRRGLELASMLKLVWDGIGASSPMASSPSPASTIRTKGGYRKADAPPGAGMRGKP